MIDALELKEMLQELKGDIRILGDDLVKLESDIDSLLRTDRNDYIEFLYRQGRRYNDIARIVGVSKSTVWHRIQRIKEAGNNVSSNKTRD